RCSAGSTRAATRPTSPGSVANIPSYSCGRWRPGSSKKAGKASEPSRSNATRSDARSPSPSAAGARAADIRNIPDSSGCRSAETGIYTFVRPLGVLAVYALAAGLVLVGCGGEKQAAPRAPRLPRDVARSLAAKSDALAVSLERGDSCTAAKQTLALERSARAAVSAGRIPAAFRRPLLSAVPPPPAGQPIRPPPPP